MNDKILQQAIKLYKQGNKKQASELFAKIIRQEPNNVEAWYCLSLCVEEKERQLYCQKK